jgi:hypothetical protein
MAVITPIPKAIEIIRNVKYMTIATASEDGQPWNTPVAWFRFNRDYVLYWASWVDNQHSKNIRDNGKAFIVIYDSTPADGKPSAGVYIQAETSELNDKDEVMQAAKVFGNDPYNSSDGHEYLGAKPRRIYKATPQKMWLNSDGNINGNFVDTRVEAQE